MILRLPHFHLYMATMISTSSMSNLQNSFQKSRPLVEPELRTGQYGCQATPHAQKGLFNLHISAHISEIQDQVSYVVDQLKSKYPHLDIRSGLHTTNSHNLQLVAVCKESLEPFGYLRIKMTELVQPDSRSNRAYIRYEATPQA